MNETKIEDFPESFRPVVRIIGVEKAIELLEELGGIVVYLPNRRPKPKLPKNERNEAIEAEYTGTNVKQLAQKYGLSQAWINQIVKMIRTDRGNEKEEDSLETSKEES